MSKKNRILQIAVTVVFLFGFPATSAATTLSCTQPVIQSIAHSDATIVSAAEQTDPVSYCYVRGYVTTTNPGPNQVNFELGLPGAWNERLLFIGNGLFAGSLDFPQVFFDLLDPRRPNHLAAA